MERKIVFELGRFLTANAGTYIARVVSSKESRGKTFFIVDGGLHHHLAAAGTFGSALRSNYILPESLPARCAKGSLSRGGTFLQPHRPAGH